MNIASAYLDLVYVSDSEPGISRRKRGKRFRYLDSKTKAVIDDPVVIQRIESLAIPPSWTDVWICRSTNGHLQATGRDSKRRKQYRYHPDWIKQRSQAKFYRVYSFGKSLPAVREKVEADLSGTKLSKRKVLAIAVSVMDKTAIRVGNQQYTSRNKTYGLTTLRNKHVRIEVDVTRFSFIGKSGVKRSVTLEDPQLVKAVKRCKDIPGYELFQYYDSDGDKRKLDSGDINEYLKSMTQDEFTAKDFRTWTGTVKTLEKLAHIPEAESRQDREQAVRTAVKYAASELGNRYETCKKHYVHPAIANAYLNDDFESILHNLDSSKLEYNGLSYHEEAVLAVIKHVNKYEQNSEE